MTRRPRRSLLLTGLAFSIAVPSLQAQIARAFVSAKGNDSNVCSDVATPCRTLAGGISQVAEDGEVVVLDTGNYGGAAISKGVTVSAPLGVAASAEAFTIDASGKVVVLRGLTIKAPLQPVKSAILVNAVSSLSIENCVISGWQSGINMGSGGYLRLKDTVIRESKNLGVFLLGTTVATIDHCRLERNAFYGINMGNGARARIRDTVVIGGSGGLVVQAGASTTAEAAVDNCLFADLSGYGIVADGTAGGSVTVSVSGSTVVGCDQGLAAVVLQSGGGTATIFASKVTVTGNNTGLAVLGGGKILSRGNNTVEDNVANGAFNDTFAAK